MENEKQKKVIQIKRQYFLFLLATCITTYGINLYKLAKNVDELGKNIDELEKNTHEMLEKTKEMVNQVEKTTTKITEKLDEIEEDIDELKTALEKRKYINKMIDEMGIDTYHNLIELHSKLLPTININDNTEILQIGDFVNLTNENVPIYCDISMKEAMHSYYGTSEVRLIQEIIMEKDGIIANVNNMDDYEIFASLGYQTVGYTLANQYSLNEDGSITPEFRCEKESVKGMMRVLER